MLVTALVAGLLIHKRFNMKTQVIFAYVFIITQDKDPRQFATGKG